MPSAIQTTPRVRIFIGGGSYAGLSCALNLVDLGYGRSPRTVQEPYKHHPDVPCVDFDINIVDERDGFCESLSACFSLIISFNRSFRYRSPVLRALLLVHLIGCPLVFGDRDYARKAWVKYSDVPALQAAQNIRIIRGSVSSVDCSSKTANVRDIHTSQSSVYSYDYFLSATGLRRRWPVVPQTLTREEYLKEADAQIGAVSNAKEAGVVVVGGGAVGIEMAAELKAVKPDIKVTLAHSRDKLLSSESLSDECKDTALKLLREADVEVLMEHRLAKNTEVGVGVDGANLYELEFTNGHKMRANEVIMAISQPVSTAQYLPSTALDKEGYVKINAE
jgi:NADPH-dependent 2,4-dienoyl-CoA reductase/sulfur reductase-like enzyme